MMAQPARILVIRCLLTVAVCVASHFLAACHGVARLDSAPPGDRSALLIVLDGLRPDYVTTELMPNLHALARRGVVFRNHHSVFPTVTRVNSASISTGCYPARHGLLGNSVFFPETAADRGLSTGDVENLKKIEAATGKPILAVPSLGEILASHGKRLLVVSSGSSGSAYLLNPSVAGAGIIQNDVVLPESLASRVEELGPVPPEAEPNAARNRRAVDAFIKIGLAELRPDVTILWLSDPDHTAHEVGIGEPKMVESLGLVDAEIARILDHLSQTGLDARTNVFVTSDHGFSTHLGPGDLAGLLIEGGLKKDRRSTDVIVVDGAIHVENRDEAKIRRIVDLLQKSEWIGAIFTRRSRPTHPEGFIPGALSFNVAHWDNPRAADILVSASWSDAPNKHGWAGSTHQGGVAGHGTTSPWDIHNTLIAAGPDLKRKIEIEVPSCNIDLAPTILHLLGIPPASPADSASARPYNMDGRILNEALLGGPDPGSIQVLERTYRSVTADGSYQLEASESGVEGTDYLDYTQVTRTASPRSSASKE